ncbi:MAG: Uma2 family endonuclease [Chloroflexota bacterium]
MTTEPSHRHFTVSDYHQMAETGILSEDDRVELIDGEIVEMNPIGGRHVTCVSGINRRLVQYLGNSATVNIQSPVQFGEYQEPEPDIAVIQTRDYGDDLPAPEDVILLIEVSDTSLTYDRGTKLPIYARAGIAECWIVDVPGQAIERHTNPIDDRYGLSLRAGRGEEIESTVVPGLRFMVDDVLG